MAASLSSLPPELLNQVICYIHKNRDQLNLALCCRSIHDVIIPRHLYCHITIKRHRRSDGGFRHRHLRGLASRLIKDPLLASCVRSVTFSNTWANNDDRSDEESDSSFGELDKDEFIKLQKDYGVNLVHNQLKKEQKVGIRERDNEDVFVAQLLAAAPNLEIFDFVAPCCGVEDSFEVLKKAMTRFAEPDNIRTPLRNLRVVACNCDNIIYELPFEYPLSFLQLPSIRELLIHNLSCNADFRNGSELAASIQTGSSPVERLELRDCRLDDQELRNVLRACRSLRTLVYEAGWNFLDPYYPKDYESHGLGGALSWQKATLENLWIDCIEGPQCWRDDDEVDFDMPNLSGFQKLRNIKVGMWVFFGAIPEDVTMDDGCDHSERVYLDKGLPELGQLLPPCLENIYIAHTSGRLTILVRALESLLRVKTICVPALKSITFEAFLTGNPEAPPLEVLKILVAAAEVELRIIDGATVRSDDARDMPFGRQGIDTPQDCGQGWDGSVTWATPTTGKSYRRRFLIEGKHN